MGSRDQLQPTEHHRVMDLVAEAGLDVTAWSSGKDGALVDNPAANPAYCYEWCFESERVVVLNFWFELIEEANGIIFRRLNMRSLAREFSSSTTLQPGKKAAGSKRADRMDSAVKRAYREMLPVRVIVGEGQRWDLESLAREEASKMDKRLLDAEPWAVTAYDFSTGEAVVTRGAKPTRYVDQHSRILLKPVERREFSTTAYLRDRSIRDTALRRARGKCEFCGEPGFVNDRGELYLETHHIIPLSEQGADDPGNVAALCPNHHREAHFGARKGDLRAALLRLLDNQGY